MWDVETGVTGRWVRGREDGRGPVEEEWKIVNPRKESKVPFSGGSGGEWGCR